MRAEMGQLIGGEPMPKLLISIFQILTATLCFAQEAKLSPEQEQVWSMEQKYWQVVEARDRDGYIALWDEEFVGWPYDSPDPIRKDVIRSDTFGKFEGLKQFRLEPKAVNVLKDVGIAYYRVTATYAPKSGGNDVVAFRCMHTWRKTNGVWRIIGGMSAPGQSLK
jgi:ketosteroid isomerase-like protein